MVLHVNIIKYSYLQKGHCLTNVDKSVVLVGSFDSPEKFYINSKYQVWCLLFIPTTVMPSTSLVDIIWAIFRSNALNISASLWIR